MSLLQTAKLAVDLPQGWDGRISRRVADDAAVADRSVSARSDLLLLHAASFALPADTDDFGGGAVEIMRSTDIFVALFEYGPESADTALFAKQGAPKRLTVDHFDQNMLQHNHDGQTGCQQFFTAAGSAYCLYVVLGHHFNLRRALPVINQVVASLQIS